LLKFSKFKKFFKVFYKNKSGRNNIGRITVYSKGVKKKYNSIPTTQPSSWNKQISLLVSIVRSKKKLVSFVRHHTGSFSVSPFVSGSYIGQFLFSSNLPSNFWVNKLPGNLVLLRYLTRYTIFSNVYLSGLKKFSLSNGTYCQVLESFLDFNLIKITLPSKKTKIFSG
jgi:ribosomal protein L2